MIKPSDMKRDASNRAGCQAALANLRVSYQPIFSVRRGAALKLCALRAGVHTADTAPQTHVVPHLAAQLALSSVGASASEAIDLYLDRTVVGDWDAVSLAQWVDASEISLPGHIHVEASASAASIEPQGRFRNALFSDGGDYELDLSIAQFRPDIIRVEGMWFANLAQHKSTRGLMATLVRMLKRRGVTTLFDRLDDARLVSFAIDCGADLVQGDALASAFSAGGRIEDHVAIASTNVVPVHFGRRRFATV